MKHLVIPSVNVFVISGDKLLLSRRANTGWLDGWLCPPGGHVEPSETPLAALLREVEEELGVRMSPEDVTFACVAARNASPTEHVAYEFVVRDAHYEFVNAEPDKCSELVWAPLDDLPPDIIDQFRYIIEHGIIGGQPYLEVGYQID